MVHEEKAMNKNIIATLSEEQLMAFRFAYYILDAHTRTRSVDKAQYELLLGIKVINKSTGFVKLSRGKSEDIVVPDRIITTIGGETIKVKPKKRHIKGKPWWSVKLLRAGVEIAQEVGPGRWRPYKRPSDLKMGEMHDRLRGAGITPEALIEQSARRELQAKKLYEDGEHELGLRADDDAETLHLHALMLRRNPGKWAV